MSLDLRPANPWVSCPCGRYRFRLNDTEWRRDAVTGLRHCVVVCERPKEGGP